MYKKRCDASFNLLKFLFSTSSNVCTSSSHYAKKLSQYQIRKSNAKKIGMMNRKMRPLLAPSRCFLFALAFYDISRENLYNNHKSGRAWPLRKRCDLFVFVESFPLTMSSRMAECVCGWGFQFCLFFICSQLIWLAAGSWWERWWAWFFWVAAMLHAPGIVFGAGAHKNLTSYGFGSVCDARNRLCCHSGSLYVAWMLLWATTHHTHSRVACSAAWQFGSFARIKSGNGCN